MFILLLCIIFGSLSFNGLTLPLMYEWFCGHPFLFILVVMELLSEAMRASRQ